MRRVWSRGAFASAVIVLSGLFVASTRADEQAAFNALVAGGYEIKAVTLVPVEVAKREQSDVANDTVAITLQKAGSVAVCYFSFGNWLALNKGSLGNTAQCVVAGAT